MTVIISRKYFVILTTVVILILTVSCQNFLEISPPTTQLVSSKVFSTDGTATSAMLAVYSEMIKDPNAGFASGGTSGITLLAGFSSDELVEAAGNTDNGTYYSNSLLATGSVFSSFWQPGYKFIYYSNSILEGLHDTNGVSDSVRRQLEGEAKFVRAFCHFYMVNLFGDIPLVNSTDYRVNAVASRKPVGEIYQQVIADLTDAQSLLSDDYSFSNGQRTRPNKLAATAMLSRALLYSGDWSNAETQASKVISNGQYNLGTLDQAFLATSTDAIWQLMPTDPSFNTWDGNVMILDAASSSYAKLSPELLGAFEAGDARRSSWVNFFVNDVDTLYYPFKYKVKGGNNEPVTEYQTVLRLAEVYLIRAEARAQQNKLPEAIADLDAVRARAGLPLVKDTNPGVGQSDLLLAIAKERQVELFAEWGHRWLDLKRTNKADEILAPLKGNNWQTTDRLYPIPKSELDNDPYLVQNPGY